MMQAASYPAFRVRTALIAVVAATWSMALAAPLGLAAGGKTRVAAPEYAPTAAILLSADLFPYGYRAPELVSAVVEAGAEAWILGSTEGALAGARTALATTPSSSPKAAVRFQVIPHGNLWLRDYGPWPVVSVTNEKERKLELVDFVYGDGVATAEDLSVRLGKLWKAHVTRVPAAVDGGNLLAVGRKRGGVTCIAATLATIGAAALKTDEVASGIDTLGRIYLEEAGCRDLIVLDGAAHAHVDMFVKAVAEDTVLVSQLLPETLALARGGALKGGSQAASPELEALAASLDRSAAKLAAAGLRVTRIPLPLPYRGAFRTYANALLVNSTAVVPTFARYGWGYDDYPDAALMPLYEARARAAYEAHGFHVRFLNADGMVYNGGAFHCVSAHVPALR